jgi:hypothetical protein
MLAQQWFVNWKYDGLFFWMPYVATWLGILFLPKGLLSYHDYLVVAPILLWWFAEHFCVNGHIWSSLTRLTEDATIKNYSKMFLFGIPLMAFCLTLILATWSFEVTFRFLHYAALYHGLKQFFGIASLFSARFRHQRGIGGEQAALDLDRERKADRVLMGGSFLLCFAYWHFHLPADVTIFLNFSGVEFLPWFFGEQLYQKLGAEQLIFNLKALFYLSLTSLIVFWCLTYMKSSGPKHWLKMGWVLLNALTYYGVFCLTNGDFLIVVFLNPIHSIGYYGINGLYQSKRRFGWLKLFGVSLLFSGISLFFIKIIYDPDRPEFESLNQVLIGGQTESLSIVFIIIVSYVGMVELSHYIFDAHIWRANEKNPGVRKYLIQQTEGPDEGF